MTRDDVVRITENVLKELTLELDRSDDFYPSNRRTIVLKYNGREIDRVSFDIEDCREYRG